MKMMRDSSGKIDLKIPHGVREIKPYAYENGLDLRSVQIPASVEKIGEGAFDGCRNLKEIIIHPENTDYSSDDGVVYSKDETRLIRVPEGHTGVLILDSPLQIIEKDALKGCWSQGDILCTEGLYPQVEAALRVCKEALVAEEEDSMPWDLEMGPDVYVIDSCGMLRDPENTRIGPALWPIPGSYTVCDGVEHIDDIFAIFTDEVFEDLTDIIIPASVTEIEQSAFDRCPNVTIHTPAGSYAETYAREQGIPYVII